MKNWLPTTCALVILMSTALFVYGTMKVAGAANRGTADDVNLTVPGVETVVIDDRQQTFGSRVIAGSVVGVLAGAIGLALTWPRRRLV